MRHVLQNVNRVEMTATCSLDGEVRVVRQSGDRVRCRVAHLKDKQRGHEARRLVGLPNYQRMYRAAKQDVCAQCGFSGHPCQLDVDHIDGDHTNDDPTNLQTLCANCHRLKTWNDGGFRRS